ncbi:helix-turn-helix transcriptional regulator [Nostocales cyanobacterium LEGE 11386]|nr:helix-turn-helix transcriptional regulator [Nostocales cyanobacterium LEGE 11386]
MTKIYTDANLDELWEEGLQTGEITYHTNDIATVETWQHSLMTPTMQLALQQILNCPFQGIMRRTYVESKTLELITLQFAQMLQDNTPGQQSMNLRKRDIECIYRAKDIITQNITNPPSLIELARQVQLNERKLKQGFRQIFGTTVFGYLHDYRLEQACQLLMTGQMNVAEVS